MVKVFFLDLPWKECCDKQFFFEFAVGGRKVLRKTNLFGNCTGWREGCAPKNSLYSTQTLPNLNPRL